MASASPVALGQISQQEFEVKAAVIRDHFLLPCWRKLLLRSFLTYFRGNGKLHPGTPNRWIMWDDSANKFRWTELGRPCYVDQWRQDRRKAGIDIEAARDCIQ